MIEGTFAFRPPESPLGGTPVWHSSHFDVFRPAHTMRLMNCEETTLQFSDGYASFARWYWPLCPVRGAILYLHGIQSHGVWFETSARRLVEAGWAVLLPDRRGSGRNLADRGHTPSARRLLLDVTESLDELEARTKLKRFHIVGVSWGGKLAMAAQRYSPQRISGLSLIAPGLFPRVDIPLSEKVRVGLSLLTARRSAFNIPLNDPQMFTANSLRQQFIRDDPLKLTQVTASFLLASRRLDRFVLSGKAHSIVCWLRVFLAGQDRIIDNNQTKAFVRELNWPGREIIEYENAQHTLEFEADAELFLRDLVEGISQ
jgi:acylglycerol lipase